MGSAERLDEENYKKLEELSTKLFLDYKYMYEYNIGLVQSTAGWRKEKEGFVKDLADAKNEIAELNNEVNKWIDRFMWVVVGTITTVMSITGVALICLL